MFRVIGDINQELIGAGHCMNDWTGFTLLIIHY